jgi:hypothetical protein
MAWQDWFRRKPRVTDSVDGYEPQTPAVVDPWRSPEVLDEIEKRAPSTGVARWDQINLDGYRNELTGIGTWERDKSLGGRRGGMGFELNFVSQVAAEERWRGSDLGARLIETIPDEMTREGWDVQVQPSDEDDEEEPADKVDAFPPSAGAGEPAVPPPPFGGPPAPAKHPGEIDVDDAGIEMAEAVDAKLEELDALQVFWEALCYERAYGGAGILVGADDGSEDLSKPLDEERVDAVNHITAFTGGWDGELVAWSWYRDVASPKYGQPEMYMLRNLGVPIAKIPAPGERVTGNVLPAASGPNGVYGPLITWVHESRVLVFPGIAASRRARVQMRGWGDSLFTRVDNVLQQYDQTWAGVANLMTDFAQGVLKIKNLAQSLLANNRAGTGVVATRGRALNMGRSIAGLMMLDSEEDFRREMASLSGLPEVLQQFALRLAAAAGMPVSLLMGQAPAGLNATGDSEIRWFYDRVASWQRKRMLPQLKRLVGLILKSKEGPADGVEPARWSVINRPLYQMSATEKADRYLKVAQADAVYLTNSVVTAEEVAATRFAGSEYNDGPLVLDMDGRAEMAAQDEADKAEAEKAQASQLKVAQSQQAEMHAAKVEATKNAPAQPQPGEKPAPADDEPAPKSRPTKKKAAAE